MALQITPKILQGETVTEKITNLASILLGTWEFKSNNMQVDKNIS